MKEISIEGRRVVYLGAIDDKVVEYAEIENAERTLNRVLFFSTILGDPLILNDGYLLHEEWGWQQLIDEHSPFSQLNRSQHLILASRSQEPVSRWVHKQAEKTESYRELLKRIDSEQLAEIDVAQSSCIGIRWPEVDLQIGLHTLLSSVKEVLRNTPHNIDLHKVIDTYKSWVDIGETVRSAWEKALISLERDRLVTPDQKFLLMGLANEAYHVNFAAGLATMNGFSGVGLSGYGVWHLDSLNAYEQQGPHRLGELLENQEIRDRLVKAGTIRIPQDERELYSQDKLANFLKYAANQKRDYQKAVAEFLSPSLSDPERLDKFEFQLRKYANIVEEAFGSRFGFAELRICNIIGEAKSLMCLLAETDRQIQLLGRDPLDSSISSDFVRKARATRTVKNWVRQVRRFLVPNGQHRTKEERIVDQWRLGSLYELEITSEFARSHSSKLPVFTP